LLHEIGHALGLTHPEDNPVAPGFTTQTTIMSYNDWPDNLFRSVQGDEISGYTISYSTVVPETPSIYDIAAIQYIYGARHHGSFRKR
jgi:serralysin